MKRIGDRRDDEIRPLRITRGFTDNQPGSVLIESGRTKVLCTVSIAEWVPAWLSGSNQAWLTAEYSMLPGATKTRKAREGRNRIDGRSQEIQRLIGRSLRSVVHLRQMPELTLWIDCDVLVADGSTRTTAINGAAIALHDAATKLMNDGTVQTWPLKGLVQAVSVGLINGKVKVDLDYREDSAAGVDMNIVYLDDGRLVEIQGAAEGEPFSDEHCQEMMRLARQASSAVHEAQRQALQL